MTNYAPLRAAASAAMKVPHAGAVDDKFFELAKPAVLVELVDLTTAQAEQLKLQDDELTALRAQVAKKAPKKVEYPVEFLACCEVMKRVGLKWRAGSTAAAGFKAWQARRAAGATPVELLAGAAKYARYCKATGREVQMMQTFFGPQEFFSADWTIPTTQQAPRPGKFDPVAHVNKNRTTGKDWDDGIIDINPR